MRTTDLANPLKAFFHSIPEGTSRKISSSLLTRNLLNAAHVTWQTKFIINNRNWFVSQYPKNENKKQKKVCFHSFRTILKVESSLSILFSSSDFQTFHLPGLLSFLSPLSDQNMGFKVKFPALQSAQIGSSYFLRKVTKPSHTLYVDKHQKQRLPSHGKRKKEFVIFFFSSHASLFV